MAKKKASQSTSSIETNAFSKGMVKDIYAGLQPKEMWSHARNAANNSVDGDVGIIGNEPANIACGLIPYTVIGTIHRYGDHWVIFSTDDISSEIGLFDDSKCEYITLVNDECLNFNRTYLITGASKENYDCTWQVYWDDNLNPSRTLNIDNVPWIQQEVSEPGSDCVLYEDTTKLDCEKIRLAPLLDTPCVKLTKSTDGGQLRNGSYQVYIAYTLNEQRVTDYIGVSNIQALFDHGNNGGSLDIEITNLDQEFENYELVILSDNQGQKVAKRIGLYSTEQSNIGIDYIDGALVSISLDVLFLRSPAYEKSDSMYVVNDWLIRQGPTEQFDFNYQITANKIVANYVVAEYNENYYYKGGNKTQFMRDEQYAFFIRWIYNTGEKSSSYHIPGRPPSFSSLTQFGNSIPPVQDLGLNSSPDVISDSGQEYNFQVFNTAQPPSAVVPHEPLDDGGEVIARGEMAYWQSTEKYPATKPEIWGDLCGKHIRHHKFPTEETGPALALSSDNGSKIRILGVEFGNIGLPTFNDGTVIPNIVGYEILRGSREGHKSILAKGLFRNMRLYDIPDQDGVLGPSVGLYPNFPYNDLRSDVYHYNGTGPAPSSGLGFGGNQQSTVGSSTSNTGGLVPIDPLPRTDGCASDWTDGLNIYPPISGYTPDIFTFHSPELMFKRPFLNPYEIRLYGAYSGESVGHFIKSEKHPQNKLLRNGAAIVAGIIGMGYAVQAVQGIKNEKVKMSSVNIPVFPLYPLPGTPINAPGWNLAAMGTTGVSQIPNILSQAAFNSLMETVLGVGDLYTGGAVSFAATQAMGGTQSTIGALVPGMQGGGLVFSYNKENDASSIPLLYRAITGVILAKTNLAIGAQKIIDLLYNLIKPGDFAYKHNSYGFFNDYHKTNAGNKFRSRNIESNYLGSSFQAFNTDYKINNLFRPDTTVIQAGDHLPIPTALGAPEDISRYCIGGDSDTDFGNTYITNPEGNQTKAISALYGALKFNFENQYGQLEGIKQTVMQNCVFKVDPQKPRHTYSTTPIFSGDTYVGRYSEKVIMPIFSDFLLGQPDQFPYNYLQRINLPYPRFWMNTRQYDTSQLAEEIISLGLLKGPTDALPNDLFYIDRGSGTCAVGLSEIFSNKKGNPAFAMRYGYMYTHCNGILDYFVESEINLSNRDWKDVPEGRYYDTFRHALVDELFHSEIIKEDNNYTYDYSLSASRFLTNLTSAGNIQPRDYNPEISETCFVNYPKRLIYSLQAQEEAKKDYWRVFLPNNYKDFKDKVNIIKPINKSGAVIFFPYQSPQMFQGLDQIETDLGTKLTIGDGGLFSQPFQNLVNSDISNEYGSCESQRGVINTPYGFFFISQAQGKIFQQGGQSLQAISNQGMKWWFNKYLPSDLLRQFPELEFHELGDNPVVGIGCQVIFDINDDIVYFCKKDYELKDEFIGQVIFDPIEGIFITTSNVPQNTSRTLQQFTGNNSGEQGNPEDPCPPQDCPPGEMWNPVTCRCESDAPVVPIEGIKIEFGDPFYFNDCSWTVSYDPKAKAWISFHDWHPELCMSSINHFLTTKTQITEDPQCPPGYNFNPETGFCESGIDVTEPAVVTINELPSYSPDQCPPGFTYNPATGTCENIDVVPVICEETLYEVKKARQIEAYGDFGTKFYENATGRPLPIRRVDSGVPPSPPNGLYDNANNELLVDITLIDPCGAWSVGCDMWRNRLNTVGIWPTDATPAPPTLQWIGFTACVTTNVAKVFCIGIGADNRVRFGVDGVETVIFDTGHTDNFKYWHVIPITLQPGTHIITLEGYNDGSYAAFGAEIYDSTPALLSAMTTPAQLGAVTLFSTQDLAGTTPGTGIGINFDLGEAGESGCHCPDGYVLANCSGELQCITIETVDPTEGCDCPDGYTLIYPNNNYGYTLPDGDCFSDLKPICRQVECNCPPGPDPLAIVTTSGQCDDLYLAGPNGDPNYINYDPQLCTYKLESQLEPNYKVGSIWRHNYRCDLFANYYNIDYPWEVELIENTGQNVNTLRSIEYQLESYVYKGDLFNGCGDDRWHDLDFNFDETIIYNTEQVSGLLRLELNPKEDPINALTYPIINTNDIQILYSKVEQKYRYNQFWDITDDRGEFTNAERQIFITQCNGYIKDLNEINLNYNKAETQRKKFRHYYNKVILRRRLSNNRKMLLKLVNSKLNLSFR